MGDVGWNLRLIQRRKTMTRTIQELNQQAIIKHTKGDLTGAITECKLTLEQNPIYAMTLIIRSQIKLVLEDYLGVIEDCTVVIQQEPNNVLARTLRGGAKRLLGDHYGTLEDYNVVIQM